jgi:hypothetical protein
MAGNTLLTIDMITRMAVRLWRNTNMFLQNIDTQYSSEFAQVGAKIGDTLRIRLPNEYTVANGPAASIQDTQEKYTLLPLSTQRHVDVAFTTAERTLKLDDYIERILMPKVAFLTANVAQDVMSVVEGGVSNFVANVDGSGNIIAPNQFTALRARAALMNNSIPDESRLRLIYAPDTGANIVGTLSGLLNPAPEISRQYRKGKMYDALGFRWYEDQTVISHTTGTFNAGGAISGAGQSGASITVTAITGTLKKGDFITIDGVYAINRLTRESIGTLRQFAVTDDVASGATTIPIYPAIVPPVGGNGVQYQTVSAAPADGAQVNLVTKAGETYIKNIAYVPDAFTLATADLWMPTGGVVEAARSEKDGISMRSIVAYVPGTDQAVDRLDVIFGKTAVRPEWGVAMGDAVA